MMDQVMQLSLKESETSKEKLRHDELRNQFLIEKGELEAKNSAMLKQKDDELQALRDQLN